MWIEVPKVDSTFQVSEEYLDRCLKCCFVAKIANMMQMEMARDFSESA